MRGFRGLSLALMLTGLLLPLSAAAQKETKDTKEAEKQLGLALIRSDEAEKQQLYQRALAALQPAFTNDANNALVWKLAGEAHAGLGHMAEADEAFDKAEQMHAEYAEEIEGLRETAWITGFKLGVSQLDAGQTDEALATLTAANALYDKRPEGYLNIASIHAQKLEIEPAIAALERAIETSHGPLYEQLDSAGQAQWRDLRRMATTNIGQLHGAAGVEAFQAQDFEAAQSWFEKARETNPYARDYLFNVVQAKWQQAQRIENRIKETPASAEQEYPQLRQIYENIKAQIPEIQEVDPNNEQLVLMLAQIEKRFAEMRGDSAQAAGRAAYAVLQKLETMPVALDEISVESSEGTAQIQGKLKNLNLAAATPVTINLTLIGQDGSQVGTAQVRVNAPPNAEGEQAIVPFEGTAPVTAPVAGWRYTVDAS